MKVGVVGLGLIGGSVVRGVGGDVVGFDVDPVVRAAARADGFAVVESLDALADRELVVVAVPPARTAAVAGDVLRAAPAAVVADTASVKEVVLAGVDDVDRFVGAHPLAGAETGGWARSSSALLAGAAWAVCPRGEGLEPLLRLGAVVDALGGRMVACTPAEHDAALARTSHVPHLAAVALAGLAGPHAALAGTALRDMTRVARADAGLWAEIVALNREPALAALDELVARLAALRTAVVDGTVASAWEASSAPGPEPAWRDEGIEGGWAGLLALGRAGHAVRALRLEPGELRAEVAR